MRALILIAFFGCLYLHFSSREEVAQQDTLSTKQSSIQRTVTTTKSAPIRVVENKKIEEVSAFNESDEMISSDDVEEYADDDDLSRLPWDDIEEGWKNNLKEYLVSIDPEHGEEMFAAYLEEKKKYVERIDYSAAEGATEEAISESEANVEYDGKAGELERIHRQNLQEIFGDHYSQVENLHKEYVESVQYLNRSSVRFSISL